MPRFEKPIVWLSLVLIALATWSLRPSSYERAIEQGMRFYDSPTNLEALRVDDFFLYAKVLDRRSQPIPWSLAEKFAQDPFRTLLGPTAVRTLAPSIFRRQPFPVDKAGVERLYALEAPFDRYLRDPWDDLMLKALYCRETGYDAQDFAGLEHLGKSETSYFDTHALLGLIMLRENQCFDAEKIATASEWLVNDIITDLGQDPVFSDLYAERLAVLFWADAGHRVERAWIDRVRDSLTNDPGWHDFGHDFSNGHTTGLALLALLYAERKDESPSFLGISQPLQ